CVDCYPYYACEFSEFIIRARALAPETVLIGCHTVPLIILQEALRQPDKLQYFKAFIDSCDVFVTYMRGAESYFRLLTDTPVAYCPVPYPVEHVRQYWRPREEKDRVILCAGETSRSINLMSHFVARRLRDRYPDFHIHLGPVSHSGLVGPVWSDNRYPHMHAVSLDEGTYEVLSYLPWQEFLRSVARTYLVVYTDLHWTKGRFPTDAAGVGTPCIGLAADSQRELFPETTCTEPFEADRMIEIASRLIEDASFYEEVQHTAATRLEEYSYDRSVKRFHHLLYCVASGGFGDWEPVPWPLRASHDEA
ncbi:MAG: hypothetical protein ACE5H5_05045, partial [Nitrospinota bacterium]